MKVVDPQVFKLLLALVAIIMFGNFLFGGVATFVALEVYTILTLIAVIAYIKSGGKL